MCVPSALFDPNPVVSRGGFRHAQGDLRCDVAVACNAVGGAGRPGNFFGGDSHSNTRIDQHSFRPGVDLVRRGRTQAGHLRASRRGPG